MPDPTAHDAAMVALVDARTASVNAAVAAANTPIGTAPVVVAPVVPPVLSENVRPAHIPEKFWDAVKGETNVEALAKSYSELERGKAPAAVVPPVVDPLAPVVPPVAAPAVVEGKPDVAALTQEFADTGVISEASRAALAAAGFDGATVDAYIEGQKAIAVARDNAGFALVGGADKFTAMATWAQGALPAADVAALNAGLSGNEAQMKLALTSLKAQYEAVQGREPSLIQGSAPVSSTTAAFASRAEVTAAMRDPRYRADPAYRATVEARVGAMENF